MMMVEKMVTDFGCVVRWRIGVSGDEEERRHGLFLKCHDGSRLDSVDGGFGWLVVMYMDIGRGHDHFFWAGDAHFYTRVRHPWSYRVQFLE